MPTTPHHSVRMDPELWAELGRACKDAGIDRPTALRLFARWYLRVPGAELPPRPPEAARE